MKRITAIIAAALVMLSMSVPVMAEPDESDTAQSSQTSASEQSADNESSPDDTPDESDAESSIDESDTEDTSDESSGEAEESTEEESKGEGSGEASEEAPESTADESSRETSGQVTEASGSTSKQDSSVPEEVKMIVYRIDAGGMNISIPSDMYVITRDTDKDDPVFSANRTTKEEVTKSFEENDIYLRANPKDFSSVINITVNSTNDTKAIGDLSALSEDKLQSVIDKLLKSKVYTGCSRTTYGGVLFLTFTIEYENSGTKIEGLQEYTICDGKCIKITYQTAGDGDKKENLRTFGSILETLRFDGIIAEPRKTHPQEESRPLTIADIDIRYIYIIAASVIGIIAIAVMMIAAIRYRKTKALEARRKALAEARKKRKAKAKAKAVFVDHDEEQKEIFSDTDKKKGTENEKQRIETEKTRQEKQRSKTADEMQNNDGSFLDLSDDADNAEAKPMTFEDISNAQESDGLDMFGNPLADSETDFSFNDEKRAELEKTDIIELPDDLFDVQPEADKTAAEKSSVNDAGSVKDISGLPDDSELFRAIEEAERGIGESGAKEGKEESDIVFADHGEKRRTGIEQIDGSSGAEGLTVARITPNTIGTLSYGKSYNSKASAVTVSTGSTVMSEGSFFDRMVERLRETNAQVGRDIKDNGRSILDPVKAENDGGKAADTGNINKGDQGDEAMNTERSYGAQKGKRKNNIEVEISRSDDGSLVIGALDGADGKPVDVEIRDATNFKEDRDREMAELGFEVANDNEIYNARKEENEENPFVVRAKSEASDSGKKSGRRGEGSRYEKLFGQNKDSSKSSEGGTSDFEKLFGKTAGASAKNSNAGSKTNKAVDTAAEEVRKVTEYDNQSEQQEKTPFESAGAAFEGDSGIVFEVVPVPKRQVVPMQSVFTNIPRLESVNAEDYNREYEQMKKSMPRNHVYAQRFSASDVPQPFVETPKPITSSDPVYDADGMDSDVQETVWTTEPAAGPEPMTADPMQTNEMPEDNSAIEFYTGYDQSEDPFANTNNDKEVLIKDHKKKSSESVGQRFRRSLGRLFSSEIPEDEE